MSRFTIPRDLYHGKGSLEELKNLQGKKAMVVVGGGSMKRFGFLDQAVAYLHEAELDAYHMLAEPLKGTVHNIKPKCGCNRRLTRNVLDYSSQPVQLHIDDNIVCRVKLLCARCLDFLDVLSKFLICHTLTLLRTVI